MQKKMLFWFLIAFVVAGFLFTFIRNKIDVTEGQSALEPAATDQDVSDVKERTRVEVENSPVVRQTTVSESFPTALGNESSKINGANEEPEDAIFVKRLAVFSEVRSEILKSDPKLLTPEKLVAQFASLGIPLSKGLEGGANSRRIELNIIKPDLLTQFSSYFWEQTKDTYNFSHLRFESPMSEKLARKEIRDTEVNSKETGWKIDQFEELKMRALSNGLEVMVYFEKGTDSIDKTSGDGVLGFIFEYQQE